MKRSRKTSREEVKERKTNTEFLTDIMDFDRTGGMVQIVIMHAIESYASRAADPKNKKRIEAALEPTPFHPATWIEACKIISEKFKERSKQFAKDAF